MGDTFGAELTVTFLGGYTISKDSSDFGWPEGGITVAARPAGELVMKIEGGQDRYSLQKLKESEPFKATFYYADKQLTGEELKKVELEWEPEKSNANIEKKVENDHILLYLGYKNPDNPQETKSGSCTVPILALYAAKGSSTAQTQENLKYYIDNDFSPLQVGLYAEESYIVISEMGSAAPIVAELKMEGKMAERHKAIEEKERAEKENKAAEKEAELAEKETSEGEAPAQEQSAEEPEKKLTWLERRRAAKAEKKAAREQKKQAKAEEKAARKAEKEAAKEAAAQSQETPAPETAEVDTADETVAEETVAEETAAEETAAEETVAEETAAEETVAEETAAEDTVAEDTPAEEVEQTEGEVSEDA